MISGTTGAWVQRYCSSVMVSWHSSEFAERLNKDPTLIPLLHQMCLHPCGVPCDAVPKEHSLILVNAPFTTWTLCIVVEIRWLIQFFRFVTDNVQAVNLAGRPAWPGRELCVQVDGKWKTVIQKMLLPKKHQSLKFVAVVSMCTQCTVQNQGTTDKAWRLWHLCQIGSIFTTTWPVAVSSVCAVMLRCLCHDFREIRDVLMECW